MYDAFHVVASSSPLSLTVILSAFVMLSPSDVNVTVGVPIASLAVKVRVTVFPALASVPPVPFEAIETDDNVGAVVSSTVTVLVTC